MQENSSNQKQEQKFAAVQDKLLLNQLTVTKKEHNLKHNNMTQKTLLANKQRQTG